MIVTKEEFVHVTNRNNERSMETYCDRNKIDHKNVTKVYNKKGLITHFVLPDGKKITLKKLQKYKPLIQYIY